MLRGSKSLPLSSKIRFKCPSKKRTQHSKSRRSHQRKRHVRREGGEHSKRSETEENSGGRQGLHQPYTSAEEFSSAIRAGLHSAVVIERADAMHKKRRPPTLFHTVQGVKHPRVASLQNKGTASHIPKLKRRRCPTTPHTNDKKLGRERTFPYKGQQQSSASVVRALVIVHHKRKTPNHSS